MNIFLAEFLGTLLLVLLGNGAIAAVLLSRSKGEGSGWIVVTAGWGFALAMGIYAVGSFSGAHLNPAVTIAMSVLGKVATDLVPQYVFGQFTGALAGAALVWLVYLPHWKATENKSDKLMCFCTKPAVKRPLANLLVEIIATAVFLFGILMFSSNSSSSTPLMIGFLIFGIGLSLGGPTGFALNPARDLAPRVMHALLPIDGKGDSEWDYAWVPILGPIVGAMVGSLFYQMFMTAMASAPVA